VAGRAGVSVGALEDEESAGVAGIAGAALLSVDGETALVDMSLAGVAASAGTAGVAGAALVSAGLDWENKIPPGRKARSSRTRTAAIPARLI
jgi:cysteine sulfinate desulfinase/cysteine desulfurase-like protein